MLRMINQWWWKLTGIGLVLYAIICGLLFDVPGDTSMGQLGETIRNLYYHVPMWFAMILLLLTSTIYSVMFLHTGKLRYDRWANELVSVSLLMGTLGFTTGSLWSMYAWGIDIRYFFVEPKIIGAMLGMFIYIAYKIIRQSVDDDDKKARITAVYSIFGFVMFIVFTSIIPRTVGFSLHPGKEGNPAFSSYDLDGTMKAVFYPAVIGWTFLAGWIASLRFRLKELEIKKLYK